MSELHSALYEEQRICFYVLDVPFFACVQAVTNRREGNRIYEDEARII
jgi:hypothetical protein